MFIDIIYSNQTELWKQSHSHFLLISVPQIIFLMFAKHFYFQVSGSTGEPEWRNIFIHLIVPQSTIPFWSPMWTMLEQTS